MPTAKETKRQRAERIKASCNGATLHTRVVQSNKKYSRKIKHVNKSIAEAIDFSVEQVPKMHIAMSSYIECVISGYLRSIGNSVVA